MIQTWGTGRCNVSLEICSSSCALIFRLSCGCIILRLGMEGSTFTHRTEWVFLTFLGPEFHRIEIVYIFKHSTVTGVYITMFVKYVIQGNLIRWAFWFKFTNSSGFVFFSSLYYLPQYFQVVLGYYPIGAGIFLIPVLVSQMVLSWISVGVPIW